MLGVTSTSDTDGPLLGEVRRAESDIRTAEGRLENPQHRLSDRLFWFNLGFQAQTNETQNDSKISATGPNKIPWKHDDALRTLFAALGRDLDDAGIQAWLHALRAWHQVLSCRLPEGFFAHAPETGAIAAMRARFDIWWALFLHSLRSVLRETNPSYARLLQALPQLRADASRPGQKFVLTALVQQWREANAARFGLLKDIHFPVVEQRAFVKHRQVQDWFAHHAPGYNAEAATSALYAALGRTPPAQQQAYWNN